MSVKILPLTQLINKGERFLFISECDQAFKDLKKGRYIILAAQ